MLRSLDPDGFVSDERDASEEVTPVSCVRWKSSGAGNDDGGEVGWAADLLVQVAEGVVGYLRRPFQDQKFRAISSPLWVAIRLISEPNSLVTFR